jgi:hypothetical protein
MTGSQNAADEERVRTGLKNQESETPETKYQFDSTICVWNEKCTTVVLVAAKC